MEASKALERAGGAIVAFSGDSQKLFGAGNKVVNAAMDIEDSGALGIFLCQSTSTPANLNVQWTSKTDEKYSGTRPSLGRMRPGIFSDQVFLSKLGSQLLARLAKLSSLHAHSKFSYRIGCASHACGGRRAAGGRPRDWTSRACRGGEAP